MKLKKENMSKHRKTGKAKTPLTPVTKYFEGNKSRKTAMAIMPIVLLGTTSFTAPKQQEPVESFATGPIVTMTQPITSTAEVDYSISTLTNVDSSVYDAQVAEEARLEALRVEAQRQAELQAIEASRPRTISRSTIRESVEVVNAVDLTEYDQPEEPVASGDTSSILGIAEQFAGMPYNWGGDSPSESFDCSGLTQWVYAKAGITIPRTSGAQKDAGRIISKSEARPGDLVWHPGHIGIYAGGNTMFDAPRSGKTLGYREIWFTPVFVTYR